MTPLPLRVLFLNCLPLVALATSGKFQDVPRSPHGDFSEHILRRSTNFFATENISPKHFGAIADMIPFNTSSARALRSRQSGCYSDESECGSYCIPADYTCCPLLEAGCRPGTYCVADGCCPNGSTCSGSGGGSSGGSCDSDEQECGDGCIMATSTCCPDGSIGCKVGGYCYLDSSGSYDCCANGDTCTGSGGGGSSGGGSCDSDEQECGDGCIMATSTCCPDGSIGCKAGGYCYLDSSGSYDCCANGDTCTGSGGGGSSGGSCDSDEQECGDGCIMATSTCCPDGSIGCKVGGYCYLDSSGSYDCCANGDTCGGSSGGGGGGGGGGASSSTPTSTYSLRPTTTTGSATSSATSFNLAPTSTDSTTTARTTTPARTLTTTAAPQTTTAPNAGTTNSQSSVVYVLAAHFVGLFWWL